MYLRRAIRGSVPACHWVSGRRACLSGAVRSCPGDDVSSRRGWPATVCSRKSDRSWRWCPFA